MHSNMHELQLPTSKRNDDLDALAGCQLRMLGTVQESRSAELQYRNSNEAGGSWLWFATHHINSTAHLNRHVVRRVVVQMIVHHPRCRDVGVA